MLAMRKLLTAGLLLACATGLQAAKKLEVYFIDVEGGQATLFAPPGGESLLIDTGWPGHNHRDAVRIAAAAKAAGIKKIDYLLITHFHADHVGGVPQLVQKLPVGTFLDHGATTETSPQAQILYKEYEAARDKGKHVVLKPGDNIPIKGLEVKVLSAAGETIASPLPGAGQPNPACAGYERPPADHTENSQSVGVLVTFGKFRLLDMGDLTKDREYPLVCPDNKIGTVNLWVVSHHGMDLSNSLPFAHALDARVAIMDNGSRKGGVPAAWDIIRHSPGLEDLWQLHFAVAGGTAHNSPDPFIANLNEVCQGKWLKLTVDSDGVFTVSNPRNHYEKTYR